MQSRTSDPHQELTWSASLLRALKRLSTLPMPGRRGCGKTRGRVVGVSVSQAMRKGAEVVSVRLSTARQSSETWSFIHSYFPCSIHFFGGDPVGVSVISAALCESTSG